MAGTESEDTSSEYRTIGVLSQGGMGQVELAVRVRANFQRLYAVKRLRPEFRGDNEFRLMFLDEGRIAGLLRHPNIVSVVDVGEDSDGPYLVMELVEGLNASAFIAAHRARHEAIPEQIVARIVQAVALGLSAAHEQAGLDGEALDLVHRDVSPQNILIDFDGAVKVTDFGIAKAFGRLAETTTGLLKGKAGYMSPEQLRFEELDHRSDLFSLGVVFYELLSGQRLYRRETATEVARAILGEPPPDIMSSRPSTHPLICELLFELLGKKPEYRPSNASEVAERMGDLLEELVSEEGELTLRDYMISTFDDERTASAKRQKSMMSNADMSSSRVSRLLPPKRPRVGRNAALGAAVLAVVVLLLLAFWNLDVFGSNDAVPVQASADEPANELPRLPTPAPVAIPGAAEVPAPSEAQAGSETNQAQSDARERRPRRRQGRRSGSNRVAEDNVTEEGATTSDSPQRTVPAETTPMTREPGTRARSHAVAF